MAQKYFPTPQSFNAAPKESWYADVERFFKASHAVAPVQTGDFTPSSQYYMYPCAPAGADKTCTLPLSKDSYSKPYWIKNTAIGFNVFVTRTSPDQLVLTTTAAAANTITVGPGAELFVTADGKTYWYAHQ